MATVEDVKKIYEQAIAVRAKAEQAYKDNKAKIPAGADQVLWSVDKWFWDNYKAFQAAPSEGYEGAAKTALTQYQTALDKLSSYGSSNTMLYVAAAVAIAAVVWVATAPKTSSAVAGLPRRRRSMRRL